MGRTERSRSAGAGALAIALALCGCQHHLVFATATKFGLDISQRQDRVPEVTFGYDRVELASIPTKKETDADGSTDAYSILGTFCVDYDGNILHGVPLTVRQRLATGVAARNLAEANGSVAGKVLAAQAPGPDDPPVADKKVGKKCQ